MSVETVTISLHKISQSVADEFYQRIVKKYFDGSWDKAIEALMIKALQEEELLQKHIPTPEPESL